MPGGRDEPALARHGVEPVDLVVANLYPFEETIAKPGVSHAEAVENIDVGGVALIRAAAKNAGRVAVVVRPSRYPEVLEALKAGGVPPSMREALALEAFEYTSGYDAAIYNYLARRSGDAVPPASVGTAEKLGGKELGYNNFVDLDAALRVAADFDRPAAVVVKHTNPCGVALADTLAGAYRAAHAPDPVSAYGGVVGLNRTVDLATAKVMKGHALDAVIAPGYEPEALEVLREKKKGAFLVMRTRGEFRGDHGLDMVRVLGGVLLQTTEFPAFQPEAWKVVTKARPTADQLRDMAFGVRVSRFVKSNSI